MTKLVTGDANHPPMWPHEQQYARCAPLFQYKVANQKVTKCWYQLLSIVVVQLIQLFLFQWLSLPGATKRPSQCPRLGQQKGAWLTTKRKPRVQRVARLTSRLHPQVQRAPGRLLMVSEACPNMPQHAPTKWLMGFMVNGWQENYFKNLGVVGQEILTTNVPTLSSEWIIWIMNRLSMQLLVVKFF